MGVDASLISRKSTQVGVVAVLGALHAILSFFPGLWRRWSILMVPFEGIIGGPILGASASIIGVVVGRLVKPEFFFIENFFGIAETVGALASGLLFTGKWKATSTIYAFLLAAFLLHPLARVIPLWTLWNVFLGFVATIPAAYFARRLTLDRSNPKVLLTAIAFTTFASVELDVMVRVFMLVVVGLYQVYPIPIGLLPGLFVTGAFTTPLEAVYTVLTCSLVGVPLMMSLEKSKLIHYPLS